MTSGLPSPVVKISRLFFFFSTVGSRDIGHFYKKSLFPLYFCRSLLSFDSLLNSGRLTEFFTISYKKFIFGNFLMFSPYQFWSYLPMFNKFIRFYFIRFFYSLIFSIVYYLLFYHLNREFFVININYID